MPRKRNLLQKTQSSTTVSSRNHTRRTFHSSGVNHSNARLANGRLSHEGGSGRSNCLRRGAASASAPALPGPEPACRPKPKKPCFGGVAGCLAATCLVSPSSLATPGTSISTSDALRTASSLLLDAALTFAASAEVAVIAYVSRTSFAVRWALDGEADLESEFVYWCTLVSHHYFTLPLHCQLATVGFRDRLWCGEHAGRFFCRSGQQRMEKQCRQNTTDELSIIVPSA